MHQLDDERDDHEDRPGQRRGHGRPSRHRRVGVSQRRHPEEHLDAGATEHAPQREHQDTSISRWNTTSPNTCLALAGSRDPAGL
jgi:hypothetical protein